MCGRECWGAGTEKKAELQDRQSTPSSLQLKTSLHLSEKNCEEAGTRIPGKEQTEQPPELTEEWGSTVPPQTTTEQLPHSHTTGWHPQEGFTLSNEAKLSVHQRQLWITLTQLRSSSLKDQSMTRNLTACQTKINTI